MITPEKWERIRALFQSALERPPDERADFLREQSGGDESIRPRSPHRWSRRMLRRRGSSTARAARRAARTRPCSGAATCARQPARCVRDSSICSAPAGWARSIAPATRDSIAWWPSRCCRLISPATLAAASGSSARRTSSRKLTHPHICTLHDVGSASVAGRRGAVPGDGTAGGRDARDAARARAVAPGRRRCGAPSRLPRRSPRRTRSASCIAISSPPTSC